MVSQQAIWPPLGHVVNIYGFFFDSVSLVASKLNKIVDQHALH